jgi:hypothetical protein
MRPQGFGQTGAGLEDLGWNDMGFEPPKPAHTPDPDGDHDAFGEVIPSHPHNLAGLTPVESPVHNQQAEIADRLSAYTPDDAGEEEEFDETAELYDPEAEESEDSPKASPVLAKRPAITKPEPAPVVEVEPAPVAKAEPAPVVRRSTKERAVPGSKEKAAFTLRLDQERHLKLRLACAISSRSAQMLVTRALDELLASMPELEAMAEKAKRKG